MLGSGAGRMLRVFDRRVDGKALLLAPADAEHLRDAETGSLWDFRGCAVEGPQATAMGLHALGRPEWPRRACRAHAAGFKSGSEPLCSIIVM